jgi:hypothetical protein
VSFLELSKAKPMLLQLAFIMLVSVAASYAFQHTETAYKMNGVCVTRYFAYGITIFLGGIALCQYKKFLGLAFSLTLSAAAFSPYGQSVIVLFPSLAPFLALLFGVTTILVVPRSRGKGFFEFLALLILPAILAESRIGGSPRLLATTESLGYYELSAITVCLVGGYFYLRYSILANLNSVELLTNGGNERDVAKASMWSNFITIIVAASGSGIAVILMAMAPVVADLVRFTVVALPLYILVLAMGAGFTMITFLYILKRSSEESR